MSMDNESKFYTSCETEGELLLFSDPILALGKRLQVWIRIQVMLKDKLKIGPYAS